MGGEIQDLHICLSPLKEELETYIAHCKELDLVSLGNTEEETLIQMLKTVGVQWQVCHENGHFCDSIPQFTRDPGLVWLKRHEQSSSIKAASLTQILETWQKEAFRHAVTIHLNRNPRPIRREPQLQAFYDLVEILYGINHRLSLRQKLKLGSGVSEDYRIILGEGQTGTIQAYPIPIAKTRRLSSFYISRLLNRFSLEIHHIPELIAPQITHYSIDP